MEVKPMNEVSSTKAPRSKKKRLPLPDDGKEMAQKLKAERVQEELKALPGWRLLPNQREISLSRELRGTGLALSFAAYAARYAESMGLKVKALVKGDRVQLSLRSPRSGQVTRGVLELARRLG